MEIQHVIKRVLAVFILFYAFSMSAQEKSSDFFTLYKGGEKIKKKEIYLKYDQHYETSTSNNVKTFSYKNKLFFEDTKRECEVNHNIKYTDAENLYKIEMKFLEDQINKVQEKQGFKPVFPLKHTALKIYLIRNNDCYLVNWKNQ